MLSHRLSWAGASVGRTSAASSWGDVGRKDEMVAADVKEEPAGREIYCRGVSHWRERNWCCWNEYARNGNKTCSWKGGLDPEANFCGDSYFERVKVETVSYKIPPLLNLRMPWPFPSKSFPSTYFCGKSSKSQRCVDSPGPSKVKSALRERSGSRGRMSNAYQPGGFCVGLPVFSPRFHHWLCHHKVITQLFCAPVCPSVKLYSSHKVVKFVIRIDVKAFS